MHIARILNVDDNDLDREIHRRRIASVDATIEVVDARHGQHALDILQDGAFWPDLILLDVNMPVLDGFEFLEQATHIYAERLPPTILTLTSLFQDRDRERMHDYSAVLGFLLKPLTAKWFSQAMALRSLAGQQRH